MKSLLSIVITFKDNRTERYGQAESARAEDGFYQVLTKEGQNIMIPLSDIKRIVENSMAGSEI